MAIIVDEDTRVLVQGITGHQGRFHTRKMLEYGTKVVAGVTPGRGGEEVEGIPVFDTVPEAVEATGATASVVLVPGPLAEDAVLEALDAGIKVIACITEYIPLHDAVRLIFYARQAGATLVGPNTFGVISSGRCKLGIMPGQYFQPGPVGVVSRSGTLSYQIVSEMLREGIGTSTVVGLGGDRVVGLNFVEVLELFRHDWETRAVVLVGEIGGRAEEEAAAYLAGGYPKPVVAYIAGRNAPPGKRMGHAGAIIERGGGTYASKVQALQDAGVKVALLPFEVPRLVRESIAW